MTGINIIELALPHIGEEYILGSLVPKNDENYKGAWDCAEFCSWLVYQGSGMLYGCVKNSGNPATADAYTGYYKRDADTIGKTIPVDLAAKTPGAFILRYSGSGVTGHIVASDGSGGTVEAHSHKDGVIKSVVTGRRWDIGILIPWIDYDLSKPDIPVVAPAGIIYRWTTPLMKGKKIMQIQAALKIGTDGIFGSKTFYAVKQFQNKSGLVPDGEVGNKTLVALGLSTSE